MGSLIISSLQNKDGFKTDIKTADHSLICDEPISSGGKNLGPDPVGMALGGLGACTAMTLKMYYHHKKIEWTQIDVHIRTEVKRVSEDELSEEEKPFLKRGRIRYIYKDIHIASNMDDQAFERAKDIASKCPVSLMMDRNAVMITTLLRA